MFRTMPSKYSAQTGTLPRPGGKERIKNTFGIGDAHTFIAKRNLDERAGAGALISMRGGPRGFADGVVSVVQDVRNTCWSWWESPTTAGQRFVEAFDHLNA